MNKKIILFVSPIRVRILPKAPKRLKKDKYRKEDIIQMFGISIGEYYKWKRYRLLSMKRENRVSGGIVYTISKEDLEEFIRKHIFYAQLKVIMKGKNE